MRISGTQIVAVSAVCTHRRCIVRPKANGILHCPCHGSEFNPDGSLMQVPVGPAPSSLPSYKSTLLGQQVTIDLS
jgi:Rieske Fe-S protein